MAQRLDCIIVVDIEATCWENPAPEQESEIIEIGLCLLDVSTHQRQEKTSLLVKPERSSVSPFCTRLTTLTQQQVDTGMGFADACAVLRQSFRSHERVWASYGDYDRIQFQRQCEAHGVAYPFGRTHINVKNLLALSLNLPREIGLDQALARLGLPLEGTHHRGHDDAWNIAAILARLLTTLQTLPAKEQP